MLQLGSMDADKRLALFLLNMSQRFATQGFSPLKFNMRMIRDEIGSYPGLNPETVSRILSKLQKEGLLRVRQRLLHIRNKPGLERIMQRELSQLVCR